MPSQASSPLLQRALRLFVPHRRKVGVWLVLILATSILGVATPLLTKYTFDRALFPKNSHPHLGLLVLFVSLMITAVVLSGIFSFVQTYLSNVIGQDVMHDLREQLFTHLQRMSLGFFTDTRTGEIQSRIANDVGGVGTVVTTSASVILNSFVFVVSSLVAMAYLSWQLTLVSLCVVPAFAYLARRVGRVRREISKSTQETLAELSVITQETLSISGILLTKMFDWQGRSAERYGEESRRLATLRVKQEMAGRAVLGLSQTFLLASPALLYLAAGFLLGSSFTPGSLVAFSALQARLFFPMQDLMNISIQIQASAALFERVYQYLDLPHDVSDSPNARRLDSAQVRGAIALRDVHFRYPAVSAPAWTLDGVTLSIEPGQIAAVVGPSGAGKTTISYLVPRLYDVQQGSIEIDGLDVREIKLTSLAEIVGMVTQETYLLHASLRENLLYANPDASDEELEAAARAALIHERIVELPSGYDTIVGERGYRLSGGEKQRVAIARVLLKDPRILILDEATSALDTVSERLVQSALKPLMAGRTTIAIAHRLSTILTADVIYVLDRGRVIERGTHSELVTHGGLYSRLYEEQFGSGLIEAHCEDGLVLASGEVVSAAGAAGAAG